MISMTTLDSVTLVTTNPSLSEDVLVAQKNSIKSVMQEIKSTMQASGFDTNNSEWLECEYQNNSYGYTVRNFGTWEAFSFKDEAEDLVLCNDHATYLDNLIWSLNEKHSSIVSGWQEDTTKTIVISLSHKRV